MQDDTNLRWFITGASTGFGRELARYALAKGDKVVGTVRKETQIAELEAEGIGALLLDVREDAAIAPAAEEAIAKLGGVDVVVNNAGYGLMGPVESLSLEEIHDVMETNFFGALNVTKAFLPRLREQGSGVVVMISSMAGHIGFGGSGAYSASKFALESLGEALAEEMAPFGVRVLNVEPGAFRTDFSGRSIRTPADEKDEYAETGAGQVKQRLQSFHGHEQGDPVKAMEALYDAVRNPDATLRLPLGADAVAGIGEKYDRLRADIEALREASAATAFTVDQST